MTIDWNAFTPWASLAGGALIGLAALWLLHANGRIAGISGIVGGLLRPAPLDRGWRIAFILGMLIAPTAWALVGTLPPMIIDADFPLLIVAGLVVGISTRYGSGCTSGHGVCGMSRLSPRSLVATGAFMASGFITVFVIRHLLGGA
ncbi:YeeE/YedE family protein [Alcanivorax sp. S6407]|uniref:YeeE/YedE family protein n=1 Tax=Alcanivorax sp. S6407 TaxID=2926424 RepID=UPI001FF1989E|nr:YeeE/YedE family protein [Alcanivorax sp. S6407]MCK0154306.1 YeeE/YedE family protein [Alcanivorax sp. S6407]